MFRFSALLRVLGRTALILYLLVATLYLAVRYVVLPNIDHWRPRIQTELSQALQTQVTIGRVQARWQGLYPHFQFDDIALFDEEGSRVLALPMIRATLAWRGLLSGRPQFSYIEAVGLDIEARRDAQHRIWILGQDVNSSEDDDGPPELALDDPVVQWLADQPLVALRDAAVTWRDDTRDSRPLRLDAVTLGLESEPNSHRMVLTATPPNPLGKKFEMRAHFEHKLPDLPRADPSAWDGTIYALIDGMSPLHWRPWVDVPGNLRSGDVSAQWWLSFAKAQPVHVAGQVKVQQGQWAFADQNVVQADNARLGFEGSVPRYGAVFEALETMLAGAHTPIEPTPTESAVVAATATVEAEATLHAEQSNSHTGDAQAAEDSAAVTFHLSLQGLGVQLPAVFDHSLSFTETIIHGALLKNAEGKLAARFDDVQVVNDDMDLRFSGNWAEGGSGAAGVVDIAGVFRHASLDGIDLYLPTSVNLDAREWLIEGLLDGYLENATATLQGDLERFPFGDGSGNFLMQGRVRDGIIDYAPGATPETSWPALHQVNGWASLNRVDLRIVAEQAVVEPAQNQSIRLRDVKAQIANIERNSILNIQGETQADAAAYLALARHSPLRRLLDGFLDPSQAKGNWQVPLRLSIPLMNVDDTEVRGAVVFDGSDLSLEPDIPTFEQVNGRLTFTETGFEVDDLHAHFLSGPARLQGGIGGERKGLNMQGQIPAKALHSYAGVAGMQRLSGSLPYQAQLRRLEGGRYALTAQSDLQGLAIDLPAPLGKPAKQESQLNVAWTPAPAPNEMYLDIDLNAAAYARFVRRHGVQEGPYFRAGAVGTQPPDNLPAQGLLVDVQRPFLDLDEWNVVVDEFSTPIEGNGAGSGRVLFPSVQRVRLQAETIEAFGLQLKTATLTAQREQASRWRMDVASAETAGTLFWEEEDGATAGRVGAHFDRLALGKNGEQQADVHDEGASTDEAEEQDWDNEITIPAIDLKVDKLRLYGRPVGSLTVEGVNEQGGRFWRLNKLTVSSPSAELNGSGIWRLTGPDRGLTLDAETRFKDAGQFLEQIEMGNVMEGGHGSLSGRFEWRHMPWRFKRADLNGQLRLELEEGRFSTLNSRSARLLELLSLQSLQRIATFSINPASLLKEGFPFDRVSGTLHIQDGVMTTNDYQVVSPIASISIGGDVDLTNDKIDLQAMVVPRLDASGASVAAGIAINPIVGLGAFVTQWLLSKPLSKAMTLHYDVTGDLDDPELHAVSAPQVQETPTPNNGIDAEGVELDDSLEESGEQGVVELERHPLTPNQ